MKKIIILLFITLIINACSSISISDGKTKVITKKETPFCDVKKIDSNCKVEVNNR